MWPLKPHIQMYFIVLDKKKYQTKWHLETNDARAFVRTNFIFWVTVAWITKNGQTNLDAVFVFGRMAVFWKVCRCGRTMSTSVLRGWRTVWSASLSFTDPITRCQRKPAVPAKRSSILPVWWVPHTQSFALPSELFLD